MVFVQSVHTVGSEWCDNDVVNRSYFNVETTSSMIHSREEDDRPGAKYLAEDVGSPGPTYRNS